MFTYSSISSWWKLVEEVKRRMTRVGDQRSKLVQLKKADSVILKVNFGWNYWNSMVRISVICSRMFEGQTLFYGCDQKRYARKKRLNIKLITKDHNQGCKKKATDMTAKPFYHHLHMAFQLQHIVTQHDSCIWITIRDETRSRVTLFITDQASSFHGDSFKWDPISIRSPKINS